MKNSDEEEAGGRGRTWFWVAVPTALLLVFIIFAWSWWDDIKSWIGSDMAVAVTDTLRNVTFSTGAVGTIFILIPLALWRARNLHKQVEAILRQVEIQVRQADTSERGATNDRLKAGAEMLGHPKSTVRRSGVIILEILAKEHPESYHVPVLDVLCGFIRFPDFPRETTKFRTNGDGEGEAKPYPHDIERAAQAVGRRREILARSGLLSLEGGFHLDLAGADLAGARLQDTNFTGADLADADLADADLARAYLEGANLRNVNLAGAILYEANLKGANLESVDVTGATLEYANIKDANLKNAKLRHSNLRNADLGGADLEGADLEGADLEGADLEGAKINGAILTGADLAGAGGLTQDMLRGARPSARPSSLPADMSWPFELGDGDQWSPKDV